jgi:hypothetical protein
VDFVQRHGLPKSEKLAFGVKSINRSIARPTGQSIKAYYHKMSNQILAKDRNLGHNFVLDVLPEMLKNFLTI